MGKRKRISELDGYEDTIKRLQEDLKKVQGSRRRVTRSLPEEEWVDWRKSEEELKRNPIARLKSIANQKMHKLSVQESSSIKRQLLEVAEDLERSFLDVARLRKIREELDHVIESIERPK